MHRPESCYRQFHVSGFRRQGASLLKALLVVFAFCGILAIVAPRYASAEKAGKELTMKGLLRTIAAVNHQYRARHRRYAASLESLAAEGKIETVIESAARAKYIVTYRGSQYAWSCAADPEVPGTAHFFVDESGVIRFRAGAAASSRDAKIDS